MPAKLKELESDKLSLVESLSILKDIEERMATIKGPRPTKIVNKFNEVFKKNIGLAVMKKISSMLQGGQENVEIDHNTLSGKEMLSLQNAPLTTCGVERNFSTYKNILSDKRTNFTMVNLNMYIVCHYHFNK